MATTIRAADFINTIGVNTHLDFKSDGYQNVQVVINSLEYLGIKNIRDSAQYASDVDLWKQVADGAGVKFDAFMPTGSPDWMRAALQCIPALSSAGILNYLEGANEEDSMVRLWPSRFQTSSDCGLCGREVRAKPE